MTNESRSFRNAKRLAGKEFRDGTLGRAITDLMQDTDTGFENIETEFDALVAQGNQAQTVIVAKTGGDFDTIEAGLVAAGVLEALGFRIVVEVYPGDYYENNPLPMPEHVAVHCPGSHETTRLFCLNNGVGQHGIVLATDTEINGLQVRSATGVNAAGFHFPAGIHDSELHDCKVNDCYIGYLSEASASDAAILVRDAHASGGSFTSMFKVAAGGQMGVWGAVQTGAAIATNWLHADGAGSHLRVHGSRLIGTNTTNALFLENTGVIEAGDTHLDGATNGIVVAASGGTADVTACDFTSTAFDLILANTALATARFHATSLDSSKMSVGANAVITGYGQDISAATPGFTALGELWLGADPIERVPLSSYSRATFLTGHISGGAATLPGGLDIDIAPGVGYINTGTGVVKVEWGADTVTATANQDFYISVNSAGSVSISSSQPSTETNITLAAGRAGPAAIIFVAPDLVVINQPALRAHNWSMDNAGLLWLSGLAVTNTALAINVGSGSYSGPNDTGIITGATPVTLTRWYRHPVTGWVTTSGDVDDGFYDDGSGTLAALAGDWKKDALYVSDNNGTATFHYVYGQAKYATQGLAEAAALPVPPVLFQVGDLTLVLAGLVVDDGTTTVTTITDERPTLGVSGSGSGAAATDHGALAGLGDDDHAQYVDLSGNAARNPLTGTLDATGGTITLPTSAAPAQTAEGSVVWDSDDDVLTVGDGAARKTMVDTASVQTIANKQITSGSVTDFLKFAPIASPAWVEGQLFYDLADKTLTVDVENGSRLNIGQEMTLQSTNNTLAQINDGQAVYVSGAASGRPTIALTDASAHTTSLVIGVATQNIGIGATGAVTVYGLVRDVDTTGGAEAWAPGDVLYLSAVTPGGLTNVQPVSPDHLVVAGRVLTADAVNGILLVLTRIGWELAELHDVLITTPQNNQIIKYDSATGLWVNGAVIAATEINPGGIEIATQAEVTTGTADDRAITPLKLATRIAAGLPPPGSHMIESAVSDNITTGTPQVVTGMTYTPPAGTWDVRYEGETEANGNLTSTMQFYNNAVAAGNVRRRSHNNGSFGSSSMAFRVTTTGAETIDVRMSTSASTLDVGGRSLTFTKVTAI